jgi:hypothetical protein
MSLSDEMHTQNVASTQDLQARVIETCMTGGSNVALSSNEGVRQSTDQRVAEKVRTSFMHPP